MNPWAQWSNLGAMGQKIDEKCLKHFLRDFQVIIMYFSFWPKIGSLG